MSWEKSAYTTVGTRLLMESISGQKLTITRSVSGTGVIDAELLEKQADVAGVTHTLELLGIDTVNSNNDSARRVKIRIAGAETPYVLHQIGIFGRQDNMSEDVLLMLFQDDRGFEIPAAAADKDFEIIFTALIAISQSAKISLELNAEMIGLKSFIRQEIHDRSAHAVISDLTIPINAWKQDSSNNEFGYTAVVSVSGITTEYSPQVTIQNDSISIAQNASMSSVCETLNGQLKFWAKAIPTADILVTALFVAPQSLDEIDENPDESKNTTSLLGDAVLGEAILGM